MTQRNIYILTGSVRTGKTIKLMEWCTGKNDVFGILTPVVNEKKVFMDVHTKEQFEMEISPEEKNSLRIGRFIFSKKAFRKAAAIIQKGLDEKSGWLIVDEIGPLELRGEGFHETVREILNSKINLNILFVIRDVILAEVLKFYSLDTNDITIVEKNADIFRQ